MSHVREQATIKRPMCKCVCVFVCMVHGAMDQCLVQDYFHVIYISNPNYKADNEQMINASCPNAAF